MKATSLFVIFLLVGFLIKYQRSYNSRLQTHTDSQIVGLNFDENKDKLIINY